MRLHSRQSIRCAYRRLLRVRQAPVRRQSAQRFSCRVRRAMFQFIQQIISDKCPFANLPEKRRGPWALNLTNGEMENCRWMTPLLVAQIEFTEWTPDGHLRHSSFLRIRDDKEAQHVQRE